MHNMISSLHQQRRNPHQVKLLICLLAKLIIVTAAAATTAEATTQKVQTKLHPQQHMRQRRQLRENKGYLYRTLDNGGGDPIIDYYTESGPYAKAPLKPDFLYDPGFPYHRVVEFYSPLCPHCVHFAPHYVEFAREFNALTTDDNNNNTVSANNKKPSSSQKYYQGIQVKFYAVSCNVHRELCKQENIHSYPSIKIYPGGSNEGIWFKYMDLHPMTLVKQLGISAVDDFWEDAKSDNEMSKLLNSQDNNLPKPAFVPRKLPEIYADAYLSLHTTLKTSVFLDASGEVPNDKKEALFNFVQLLQKVLPPWRIHKLLEDLLGAPGQMTRQQRKKPGFQFYETIQNESQWNAILEKHPPRNTDWSPSCRLHDSPYTCGLWTLFHIATLGVMEYNAGLAEENQRQSILGLEATAQKIRNFVQHFLLCEVCSTHFVQEFDQCLYQRCTRWSKNTTTAKSLKLKLTRRERPTMKEWKEFPLWLLETHNGVNVRLQQERFEQAGKAKPTAIQDQQVMWPPMEDCPTCWLPFDATVTTKTPRHEQYDHDVMYNYLRFTYWPQDSDLSGIPSAWTNAMISGRKVKTGSMMAVSGMVAIVMKLQYVLVALVVLLGLAVIFNRPGQGRLLITNLVLSVRNGGAKSNKR